MTWCMGVPGINSGENSVLMILANSANDDNECWPGIPILARRAKVSERQAQRILRSLEKKKRIEILRRKHENGQNRSNVYRLLMTPAETQNISYATSFERARALIRSQVTQNEFHIFYEPLRVLYLHRKTLTLLAPNIFVESHILSPERKDLLLNACREAGFEISEVLIDASGVSMLNDPPPGKPGRPAAAKLTPHKPAPTGKATDELKRRLSRKK